MTQVRLGAAAGGSLALKLAASLHISALKLAGSLVSKLEVPARAILSMQW